MTQRPNFLPENIYNTKAQAVLVTLRAPLVADLISIKAAATPADGAITIAAQPDCARKLQVRIVIDTTHAITAGTLTLVGLDQDGNAITEVVSLVTDTSVTLTTVNAFAVLTSGTVADLAATGGQGSNTLGIGRSAALGIPTVPGVAVRNFKCIKETVIVSTFTGAGTDVTDVAVVPANETVGAVDAVARTVSPTTAPGATATTSTDFSFLCTYERY